MDKPLVSVILCFYNEENYLGKAIKSIINQSYKQLELILIDDNSTDKSLDIAIKHSDPRIRIIGKDNRIGKGLASSRNLGVSSANGSYIIFQDADDVCHKDRIREKINYVQKYGECIIGSWLWVQKGDKINLRKFPANNLAIKKGLNRFFNRNVIAGQVVMYPKWVLEKYPYNIKFKYMQDYDQLFRVIEGESIEFTNIQKPLYTYVLSDKGVKAQVDWPIYNYFVRRCKWFRKKNIEEPDDIDQFILYLERNKFQYIRWRLFNFLIKSKIKYLE